MVPFCIEKEPIKHLSGIRGIRRILKSIHSSGILLVKLRLELLMSLVYDRLHLHYMSFVSHALHDFF